VAFRDAFPIFHTPDLARAVAFSKLLGFEETYKIAGFVVVALGPFSLGFAESSEVDPPGRVALWLSTDDLDAEIEALREVGAEVVREPEDQEWGERMAAVLDPDGNEVFLGQRLAAS
jgi:lactoylglutathione lyase